MGSRNVVVIKSSIDTRYAVDAVVTHDGTKFPCWALPDLTSFKNRFGSDAYEKVFLCSFSSFSRINCNSTLDPVNLLTAMP